MVEPTGGDPSHSDDPSAAITRVVDLTCDDSAADHVTEVISTDQSHAEADDRGLRIRCPHCQNPVKLSDESSSFDDINCPDCGSDFSLIGQEELATRDTLTPKQFGHFELIELLGVGGFGSVWKARDRELDRSVAIKIPRKNQLDRDESEKFFREARAAAQLRHPNIVSVHEVGRHEDTIYIVSDLIDGVPLDEWLSVHPMSPRQSVQLCLILCDAVDHAHDAGVIHRDLKPGNILLDGDGEPHVMDFGLAKRETGEVTMTIEGRVLGTPAYMSPEQARGEGHDADRRTDIYSLGVVLYQLLTGELPFRGTPRMLVHQVLHHQPRPPRSLNDGVPRDLETITLKCLQKDPARRYSTAGELRDELRRYLNDEPIHARPAGRVERAIRWCRRHPVIAGLTAAVFLLCVSVASVSSYAAMQISQSRDDAIAAKDDAIAEQQKAQEARQEEAEQRRRAELAESDAVSAAQLARQEAETAHEVSNFLVNMFKASTPFENSGFLLGSTDQMSADMTAHQILDRGTEKVLRDLIDQPSVQADLLESIGSVYLGVNDPEAARPLLEKALQLRRAQLPADHPKIASLLFQQGYEHFVVGDYQQSKQLLRQSLQMRQRALGEDHPVVTQTKQVLGTVMVMASRNWIDIDVDEAEILLRDVLDRLEATAKKETTEYGFAALALCGVFNHQPNREVDQAKLLQTATEVFAANPDTKRLGDAIWLSFNARIKARIGQPSEAAKLYSQAVEILRDTLGTEHWAVMWIVPYFAESLADAKQFEQAESTLIEFESGLENKKRTSHPHYARLIAVHALLLLRDEQVDKATVLGDRLIAGPHHGGNRVVNAFSQIGRAHHDAGNFDQSLKFYAAAVDGYREVDEDGVHHGQFFAKLLTAAGVAARQLKRYDVSEQYLRRALEVQANKVGVEHEGTLRNIAELATTLGQQQDFDGVQQIYESHLNDLRSHNAGQSKAAKKTVDQIGKFLDGHRAKQDSEPATAGFADLDLFFEQQKSLINNKAAE